MGGIASSLDPGFQARTLGFSTTMVAAATLEAAGVAAEGDRGFGLTGDPPALALWRRLVSHLSFRSVWFRNAVRGSAGLALAVTIVEVTDVEHGFWVVLGTLSVLRSNALGTGATALRAVGGTAVGFVLGSAIMIGVGGHAVALWALLPVAVLVSGVAPSMHLLRRRAGRVHAGGGHSVQHHRARPAGGWVSPGSRTWRSVAG